MKLILFTQGEYAILLLYHLYITLKYLSIAVYCAWSNCPVHRSTRMADLGAFIRSLDAMTMQHLPRSHCWGMIRWQRELFSPCPTMYIVQSLLTVIRQTYFQSQPCNMQLTSPMLRWLSSWARYMHSAATFPVIYSICISNAHPALFIMRFQQFMCPLCSATSLNMWSD